MTASAYPGVVAFRARYVTARGGSQLRFFQFVFAHAVVELCARDPEAPGGLRFVPPRLVQNARDRLALHRAQITGGSVRSELAVTVQREVLAVDQATVRENRSAL